MLDSRRALHCTTVHVGRSDAVPRYGGANGTLTVGSSRNNCKESAVGGNINPVGHDLLGQQV